MKYRILLVVAVALVAAACASGGDVSNDAATSGLVVTDDPNPAADDGDSLVDGDGIPVQVAYATAHLAEHLGVSEDVIDWVSFDEVTWSNGAIGCPEEGMAYTEALVDGSLTVFEVDGAEYRYHAETGTDPFLCLTPVDPLPDAATKDL
ncbi:MAG: hypothetical protein ABFR95_01885 [Actinomycetota bacterium]